MAHPKERRFEEHLRDRVRGKSVLDLGCVDHTLDSSYSGEWIHDMLIESASRVVGVDILEEPVAELQAQGYDIRVGDAQELHLDQTFDIVFLGDLIEHLVDFRGLLESVDRHLNDQGKVIIMTPNCNSLFYVCHRILGYDINPEHTVWFDASTLRELLSRHGFELTEVRYSRQTSLGPSPVEVLGYLTETLLPDPWSKGKIIVVAERKGV